MRGIGLIGPAYYRPARIFGRIMNRRKYRLDLSTEFACKFRELIARPLEDEVVKLRTEVNQLRDAIQRIGDCPHSGSCPVRDELAKSPTR